MFEVRSLLEVTTIKPDNKKSLIGDDEMLLALFWMYQILQTRSSSIELCEQVHSKEQMSGSGHLDL